MDFVLLMSMSKGELELGSGLSLKSDLGVYSLISTGSSE